MSTSALRPCQNYPTVSTRTPVTATHPSTCSTSPFLSRENSYQLSTKNVLRALKPALLSRLAGQAVNISKSFMDTFCRASPCQGGFLSESSQDTLRGCPRSRGAPTSRLWQPREAFSALLCPAAPPHHPAASRLRGG